MLVAKDVCLHVCVCACMCECMRVREAGGSVNDSPLFHNTVELYTSLIADKNEPSAVSFKG